MGFPTDRVNEMTDQINELTDCRALLFLIDDFIDELSNMISEFIKEQLQILSDDLPLLSLPGPNPVAIVKWLKKLVIGRILPRLRAYIKLLKQIAEFVGALQRLQSAIQSIPDKIERCAGQLEQSVLQSLNDKVQSAIDSVTAPIDNALAEINLVQDQFENILENPLNERIVTDSLDTFLATVDKAEAAIVQQSNDFLDEPLPVEPEANTA